MDHELKFCELYAFFQFTSEARAIARKPKPSARKLYYCLDELVLLARCTKEPILVARCRAVLEDFALHNDGARRLLEQMHIDLALRRIRGDL